MVAIPTPKGGRFCIDSTEVTRGQYAQFLAAKKADTSGQTTECKQNTTFQPTLEPPNPPGQGGPGCPLHDPLNPEKPNTPMVCIDWCDAKAYCAWAGKRLCGKIGGGQLSSQGDDYSKWDGSNPSIGEWAFTCSQGASTKYPYGNEHKDGACVDDAYRLAHKLGASDQVDVGADPTCHGQSAPYNTVVDLVGSVQEFEDSFIAPKFGAFRWNDNANGFTCTTTNVVDIAATSDSIGFRCCAD
jgi:formylglycine-generating enzyme required for sulfatase activity